MFQGRNTNQRVHVSVNASWRHWDFYFRGVWVRSNSLFHVFFIGVLVSYEVHSSL